jgi:flagellar hook-associated protein 3 FlgL
MLLNAISTLGLFKRTQASVTGLQLDVSRVGQEIASGKKFDVAGELGPRTGEAISLRSLYDRSDEYTKTCSLLDARMTLMSDSLKNIDTVASDVLALATAGASQPSQTGIGLQIKARGALDQMAGLLNASIGGRYLFAGVQIDKAPMRQIAGDPSNPRSPLQIVQDAIAATPLPSGSATPTTAADAAAVVATLDALFDVRDPATPAPAPLTDTFEGGIYTGTTALQPGGAPSPRVAGRPEDGTELQYGIQANDKPMRDVLEGLFMLAAVDTHAMPQAAYKTYMDAAITKLSGGTDGVRRANAMLGIQQASVEDIQQRHTARMKVLNEQINGLEDVDPAEASTRLNALQAQLEATLDATTRIARLHLTNFR